MTPKALTTIAATAASAVAATIFVILVRPILPFLDTTRVPAILGTAYIAVVAAWLAHRILAICYNRYYYWNWKHASGALVVLIVLAGALIFISTRLR